MRKQLMHNPPHPGEILKTVYLDEVGMTITDAARALGVTRKTLSSIINEKCGISTEMALRLSKAFDTTPELWLNMQQSYDLWHTSKTFDPSSIESLRIAG